MKTLYSTIAGLFLLCTTQLVAQSGATSTAGQNPLAPNGHQERVAPADPDNPQDGSTFLGPVYQNSACGLNYTTATQKLGQRLSSSCCPATNGVPQPATFTISGIPATAVVVKAFIWCDASGNGIPITLNITNPTPTPFTVPMNVVGGDVDKCWGYAGVYTYRADITATISGNGNYVISGFPTNPPVLGNDVDGATMMVIWMDPTAGYEGNLVIWDGAVVKLGASVTQTMSNFTACQNGNISNARGFAAFGDLQTLNSGIIINGMAPFPITEDWWNYVDVPTTVTPGQNTSTFGNVQNNGDCYNFCLMGLYWQDDCNRNCEIPCVAKADFSFTGCNPVQFTGSNSGPSAMTSWYWDFGDGQTSTLQNPSHTYAVGGTYKVCLTITAVSPSGQSCCDQVCYNVVACQIQPCTANASFTWAQAHQINTLAFTNTSTGTGTPCGYFWDFGDGFTSTLANPIHTYANSGIYFVCLTVTYCVYDAAGNLITTCSGTFCKKVSVGLIIDQPSNERNASPQGGTSDDPKKVSLYPNPATSELFINASEDLQPTVNVLDATGQVVMKATLSAKNLYKVNVQQLAAGMYTIEVTYSNGTVERAPFVKQ
jgi:hypothetical protein